jgi:hypothetical protein
VTISTPRLAERKTAPASAKSMMFAGPEDFALVA